jgi:hypothetical protein
MSADRLRELGKDIVENGLNLPIELWRAHPKGEAELLDGRNRLDAIEVVTGKPLEIGGPSLMAGDFLATDKVIELDGRCVDPYARVVSLNILRRDLKAEDRQNALINLIARTPEKSDRQFGEEVGVDHKTIARARAKGEDVGRIPHVKTRTDTKGREQPSRKPSGRERRAAVPKLAVPDDAELIAALNAAPHWSDAAWTRVLEQLPFERFMRVKPLSYGPKLARLETQYSDLQARRLELVYDAQTDNVAPPAVDVDDGLGIPDFLDRTKRPHA